MDLGGLWRVLLGCVQGLGSGLWAVGVDCWYVLRLSGRAGLRLLFCVLALGVGQFFTAVVALQWIFAFTIMAVLFVLSVIVGFPDVHGIRLGGGHVVNEDRERAPLLSNEN